ncbi:hypothetical protein BH20ACT2_BH20ACT2_24250 [soil metagenome]
MAERNMSKARRQARNRSERDARIARREAANRADRSPATPETGPVQPPRSLRGARARGRDARRRAVPTVGAREDATGPLLPLFFGAVPGGRPIGYSFVFALTASVSLLFLPFVEREEAGGGTETVTLLAEAGAGVLGLLAVPVLLTLAAVAVIRRPGRRQAWTVSAVLMGAWVALTLNSVGVLYLFSAGALGLGAWQVRQADKAEQADLPEEPLDDEAVDDAHDPDDPERDESTFHP